MGCASFDDPEIGSSPAFARIVPTAGTVQFASGTLIIPLDRQADESKVLPSYGLVYGLLSNNVPVQWAIKDNKATATDTDVQVDAGAGMAVSDLASNTAIALPATYQGGAFLIDASDAVAAKPRIQAWKESEARRCVIAAGAGPPQGEVAARGLALDRAHEHDHRRARGAVS